MDSEASMIGFWGSGSEHLHQEHQAPWDPLSAPLGHLTHITGIWSQAHPAPFSTSVSVQVPHLLDSIFCDSQESWVLFDSPLPLQQVVSLTHCPHWRRPHSPLLAAHYHLGLLVLRGRLPALPPESVLHKHSVSIFTKCKYSETVHKL